MLVRRGAGIGKEGLPCPSFACLASQSSQPIECSALAAQVWSPTAQTDQSEALTNFWVAVKEIKVMILTALRLQAARSLLYFELLIQRHGCIYAYVYTYIYIHVCVYTCMQIK